MDPSLGWHWALPPRVSHASVDVYREAVFGLSESESDVEDWGCGSTTRAGLEGFCPTMIDPPPQFGPWPEDAEAPPDSSRTPGLAGTSGRAQSDRSPSATLQSSGPAAVFDFVLADGARDVDGLVGLNPSASSSSEAFGQPVSLSSSVGLGDEKRGDAGPESPERDAQPDSLLALLEGFTEGDVPTKSRSDFKAASSFACPDTRSGVERASSGCGFDGGLLLDVGRLAQCPRGDNADAEEQHLSKKQRVL